MVAHESLTEARFTMKRGLAVPRSLSNVPAFFDVNDTTTFHCSRIRYFKCFRIDLFFKRSRIGFFKYCGLVSESSLTYFSYCLIKSWGPKKSRIPYLLILNFQTPFHQI